MEQLFIILHFIDFGRLYFNIFNLMFGNRDFSIGDAFVGFHEDTIPSIVMQVCNEIGGENHSSASYDTEDTWEMKVRFTEMSF